MICSTRLCALFVLICGQIAFGETVLEVFPSAPHGETVFTSPAEVLVLVTKVRAKPQPAADPITILIHAGTYFLDQPLKISGNVSSAKSPLTIEAAPGEPVVFSGGHSIANWRDATIGTCHCW